MAGNIAMFTSRFIELKKDWFYVFITQFVDLSIKTEKNDESKIYYG